MKIQTLEPKILKETATKKLVRYEEKGLFYHKVTIKWEEIKDL